MNHYVALLRGINLGNHNKISMPKLQEELASIGFKDIKTYLQSGNIIFKSDISDTNKLATSISEMILNRFGYGVPAIVLTAEQLKTVTSSNPYLNHGNTDPTKLHVTFLAGEPESSVVKSMKTEKREQDKWSIIGGSIYLYCPNGYGRTQLNNNFFERKFKLTATTRNWKTLLSLAGLSNQ